MSFSGIGRIFKSVMMTEPDPDPDAPTTMELLRLYRSSGSGEVLGKLIARYLPLVYATARRRTGSDTLATDVAQLVFIDFARQARSLPANLAVGGWLLRHTGFRASRALRTERRRGARENEALRRTQLHTTMPDAFSEISGHLDEALQRLTAGDQALLVSKFYEEQDIPDIAHQLGITSAAAQKRMERALQRLRKLMPGTPSVQAITLAAGSMFSPKISAAGLPAGLSPSLLQASLTAAANQPVAPWLVRLRHMGPGTGGLLGAAAALVLSAGPIMIWEKPEPAASRPVLSSVRNKIGGSGKDEAIPSVDDVFSQLKALVDREGWNRLTWRKAQRLVLSLPVGDSAEAIVRLDQMFPITGFGATSAGPDRWVMLLLHRWRPASVPQALSGLLPRLSPALGGAVASSLYQEWVRNSPGAALAGLTKLLEDETGTGLPHSIQGTGLKMLGYSLQKELMRHDVDKAIALGSLMNARGFDNMMDIEMSDAASLARSALLEQEHPWYQPAKDVLGKKDDPAGQRALTLKIGDPATKQHLTVMLARQHFGDGNLPSMELNRTAAWLKSITEQADRPGLMRQIANAWPGESQDDLRGYLEIISPADAELVLDRENLNRARSPNLSAEGFLAAALRIKDAGLRDYVLAARLARESDTPRSSGSWLDSPLLPEGTAAALRQSLLISP